MPLAIGFNVKYSGSGRVILESDNIRPFMISVAVKRLEIESNENKTIFNNNGIVRFQGPIKFHPGAKVWVMPNGNLTFGGYNTIGARSLIACDKGIHIGYNSGCSWDCEILDTDFHYMEDLENHIVYPKSKKIEIEDNVFIGNHVNICKGSKIPQGSIISSWSKITGSYMRKGENLLFSNPIASIVGSGYTMTHAWDSQKEQLYNRRFTNK